MDGNTKLFAQPILKHRHFYLSKVSGDEEESSWGGSWIKQEDMEGDAMVWKYCEAQSEFAGIC